MLGTGVRGYTVEHAGHFLMKLEQSITQAEQYLESLEGRKFDRIAFDWEGIRFNATTEKRRDGTFEVQLHAILGRLYYTAENAAHRTSAIERLFTNNRKIDGAYSIDGQGEVHFNSLTTTREKPLGDDLLAALATILIQAEGHLRTLKAHLKPC